MVAEELLSDPRTAAIPFVFLSAKAESGAQHEGISLGALDYLTKPFDPVEMRAVLDRLLGLVGDAITHRESHLAELRLLLER